MSHIYSGLTKYSPCVSKLKKLSKEYLSPQKTQKAAVFFIQKNLDLKMIKNFNKFKNTYYICTHSKSLKLHGIPPPKMQFFKFFFCSVYFQLFINEDILNFYHGWVCQRFVRFHIQNRRKLCAAASRCRRRKVTKTSVLYILASNSKTKKKFGIFF